LFPLWVLLSPPRVFPGGWPLVGVSLGRKTDPPPARPPRPFACPGLTQPPPPPPPPPQRVCPQKTSLLPPLSRPLSVFGAPCFPESVPYDKPPSGRPPTAAPPAIRTQTSACPKGWVFRKPQQAFLGVAGPAAVAQPPPPPYVSPLFMGGGFTPARLLLLPLEKPCATSPIPHNVVFFRKFPEGPEPNHGKKKSLPSPWSPPTYAPVQQNSNNPRNSQIITIQKNRGGPVRGGQPLAPALCVPPLSRFVNLPFKRSSFVVCASPMYPPPSPPLWFFFLVSPDRATACTNRPRSGGFLSAPPAPPGSDPGCVSPPPPRPPPRKPLPP